MGIARQGLREIATYGGSALVIAVGIGSAWSWWLSLPFLALAGWTVWFFRDPTRVPPEAPGAFVAPADGTVDDIREEHDDRLGGPAWRIGIYLSLFSVHINRVPRSGRVIDLEYRQGRRRATYRVGETDANEQQWSWFESIEGIPFAVRQIAGPAARRVVNELEVGSTVRLGARFGLIKFGSRTELWLPRNESITLTVALGDRVHGAESILANARVALDD